MRKHFHFHSPQSDRLHPPTQPDGPSELKSGSSLIHPRCVLLRKDYDIQAAAVSIDVLISLCVCMIKLSSSPSLLSVALNKYE